MMIRPTSADEAEAIAGVHREAFAAELEAELARDLMRAPDFVGSVSFAAESRGRLLGHALFTRAWLEPDTGAPVLPLLLLAPLAVVPDRQRQGVGTALVLAAITLARESGELAMVVFGDPAYYRRFGFVPAFPAGITTPHPAEPEWGWQVLTLAPGRALPPGVVRVAAPLDLPEMWRV